MLFEQTNNDYIDHDKNIKFNYFFAPKSNVCKVFQSIYSNAWWFWQALSIKLFETITLVQPQNRANTHYFSRYWEYWKGLLDWIREVLLQKFSSINAEDLHLLHLVDTEDQVIKVIEDFFITITTK